MSSAALSNGKPQRKQLSEQLDRFDAMLDGLGEGLSEAVTDAARAGTQLAVKDAIVEILTDPALRAQLHEATAPISPQKDEKSRFWAWIKSGAKRVGAAIQRTAARVTAFVHRVFRRASEVLHDPLEIVRMLGS